MHYICYGCIVLLSQGTNGSQLWDTAFATQALLESSAANDPKFHKCLEMAHHFFKETQVLDTPTSNNI